jgi:hypothetical protein
VIQLGNEAPLCGAVEVDPVGADWRAHGHAGNPAFEEVILHVIWNGPAHTALPTLLLQPYLDAPWAELAEELAGHTQLPAEFAGQCRAPLAALTIAEQNALLNQAAAVQSQTDGTPRAPTRLGCYFVAWPVSGIGLQT